MRLGILYHWSPTARRIEILKNGLQPFSRTTVSGDDPDGNVLAYPYVCLSPSPSAAWALSGDLGWATEVEEWDLWQAQIPENVEVHIRPNFGPVVEEIKAYGVIPPDHLWLVATRSPAFAIKVAA